MRSSEGVREQTGVVETSPDDDMEFVPRRRLRGKQVVRRHIPSNGLAPTDGEASSCDVIDEEIKDGQTDRVGCGAPEMLHGVCQPTICWPSVVASRFFEMTRFESTVMSLTFYRRMMSLMVHLSDFFARFVCAARCFVMQA